MEFKNSHYVLSKLQYMSIRLENVRLYYYQGLAITRDFVHLEVHYQNKTNARKNK